MSLSEYEKQRLENIKRNEALLRTLHIPTIPRNKASPKSSPLRKHKPVVKKEPKLPSRVSARIRGEPPSESHKRGIDNGLENDAEQIKKLKTIDSLGSEDQAKILGLLKKTLVPNTKPTAAKVKQEQDKEGRTPDEVLRDQLADLEIKHSWTTVKVTPQRISGCLFHPSDSKLLACAVDVEGYLGLWDIKGEDEEGEPIVYNYKPHTRTITDIHFNPTDNSKLMTSSYDGLIRTFDMNKAEFETWDLKETYPITSFDISQDGHTIWFSTSDGEVGMKDTRAKGTTIVRQSKEKKIGCVHLNPLHQGLLAAASNDRTASVWDVRMWKKHDLKGELTPLHSFDHGYSVTSCYWSPNGDMLATASYDDYIRVFNLDKKGMSMELKSAIEHNNHTGSH